MVEVSGFVSLATPSAATAWLAGKVAQTEVGRVGSGGNLLSPAGQLLLVDPPAPVVTEPSADSFELLAPPLPAVPFDPPDPGLPAVGPAPAACAPGYRVGPPATRLPSGGYRGGPARTCATNCHPAAAHAG